MHTKCNRQIHTSSRMYMNYVACIWFDGEVVLVSPKEFIALHSNWIDLLPLYFSEKMHREWDWGTAI